MSNFTKYPQSVILNLSLKLRPFFEYSEGSKSMKLRKSVGFKTNMRNKKWRDRKLTKGDNEKVKAVEKKIDKLIAQGWELLSINFEAVLQRNKK